MHTLSGGALLGIMIGMIIVWWLRPLNTPAVTLVMTLSTGLGSLVGAVLGRRKAPKS